MSEINQQVQQNMEAVVDEWITSEYLKEGDLFVVGCSTSEVAGKHIGTSGSEELAEILFRALSKLPEKAGVHLAFQGCEHINRALVLERETANAFQYDVVSVVPIPTAGGSMAAFAYKNMKHPVVVEAIQAHAGIDIGETMIGMHLKPVAVPLRFEHRFIGEARITGARTRPKLIGGQRASY